MTVYGGKNNGGHTLPAHAVDKKLAAKKGAQQQHFLPRKLRVATQSKAYQWVCDTHGAGGSDDGTVDDVDGAVGGGGWQLALGESGEKSQCIQRQSLVSFSRTTTHFFACSSRSLYKLFQIF